MAGSAHYFTLMVRFNVSEVQIQKGYKAKLKIHNKFAYSKNMNRAIFKVSFACFAHFRFSSPALIR